MLYSRPMFTVAETPTFSTDAARIWDEEERGAFCAWLAVHPKAGDVIPGSGGCRKVRWRREGIGKRGGVRVVYYLQLEDGRIWLLTIYPKSMVGNIPAPILKAIREEIERGHPPAR
jgi:hypothetical protein